MSVRAWLHPIWGQTELCRWADLLLRDVSCLRRDAKLFTVQCSPAPRRYMPFLGLFWEDFLHCDGHLFYEFETRLYYNLSMPAGVLPAVVAHDVFGGNFSWLCGWKPQVWSNIEIKATVYYSLKSTFVWSFLAYCIFFFFLFFSILCKMKLGLVIFQYELGGLVEFSEAWGKLKSLSKRRLGLNYNIKE